MLGVPVSQLQCEKSPPCAPPPHSGGSGNKSLCGVQPPARPQQRVAGPPRHLFLSPPAFPARASRKPTLKSWKRSQTNSSHVNLQSGCPPCMPWVCPNPDDPQLFAHTVPAALPTLQMPLPFHIWKTLIHPSEPQPQCPHALGHFP